MNAHENEPAPTDGATTATVSERAPPAGDPPPPLSPPKPATVCAETARAPAGLNLVSLARPYFGLIVLTSLVLATAGVAAMLQMPSGIYPEVAFPRISIIVQTTGADVRAVEKLVTRPIEEAAGSVPGKSGVRSKTVRGAAEINVDFMPGSDMAQALNDVRAKLAIVSAQFPPGSDYLVERQSPSVFPIISFVVTGGRDPAALRDYAYYDLRPRISHLQDVAFVVVQGGDEREIVIEIDPQRLVAAGLSMSDVADRLGKEHHLRAVGKIDRGPLQYQVLVNTQATEIQDLENLVVAQSGNQTLRVCDVGRVIVTHADHTNGIRANGKNAVGLTIYRRLNGNALAISDQLDRVLDEARTSAPPGIDIVPIYDQGTLVRTSIANVRDAMLIGGVLSVVVLLMFLKSIRATLLTAISIPLTLAISFLFLRMAGDTLNLMSLGGLAVAIGMIIDDSVVVVENIARHLAEGQSGDEAVERASREISGAVIGSTLTTILVFLPLAFVRGVVGQFFQSLSLSLSIALLVSMVVSLTIIPVLAARFLANRPMPHSGPIYNAIASSYERMLRQALRVPRTMVVLALLAVIPGYLIYRQLKSDFMPDIDEGAFVLDYYLPPGTSLVETDAIARHIDAILLDTPEVAGFMRRTGAENGLYATENCRGDITVALKPVRRRTMGDICDDVEKDIEAKVPYVRKETSPLIHDQINDLNGIFRPVEVKIFGPDEEVLRELAEKIKPIVEASGAQDVDSHALKGNPDLVVRPDRVAVARAGLNEQDVENQLSAALYGQVAATLPQQDRITNIRVRYPDSVRFNRNLLAQLPIAIGKGAVTAGPTSGGSAGTGNAPAPGFVMLGQLASIEEVRSPNEVRRENQQPMIFVTGKPAEEGGDLGKINRYLEQEVAKVSFPRGYRWELGGEYKAQQESFASLTVVLLMASLLVFMLLGFQFRSLTLPLLIFLCQPISLASALAALWITGTPLNVSSFMGAILLIGLDVKNGIILIEYIGQLSAGGMPLDEALVVAGRTRFRPILMTSLTAIFGLAPLALGLGPGAQMQKPLAIAVIGGLIVNMLLTRLLIPVGYRLLRRLGAT